METLLLSIAIRTHARIAEGRRGAGGYGLQGPANVGDAFTPPAANVREAFRPPAANEETKSLR
jgi:hypothetical protein